MISRRSLLTKSAVGTVALAAAVAARELPALASDANMQGERDHNHNGNHNHKNGGRNRDRNRRTNGRRKGRGNGGGGLANGPLPTTKSVVIEGNGDPSDNLEQKRDRRHNRRERRRDRRRRDN